MASAKIWTIAETGETSLKKYSTSPLVEVEVHDGRLHVDIFKKHIEKYLQMGTLGPEDQQVQPLSFLDKYFIRNFKFQEEIRWDL